MRKLSSVILALVLSVSLFGQKSPHGDDFLVSCKDCHKTDGWKVDLKTISFDHDGTKFPLVGQHQDVTCKACHTSLEFTKAATDCNSCHTDIHQQTVGLECARCHTPNSWVVSNIAQIHQQSSFPLIGPHATVDCYGCHTNIVPSAKTSAGTASLLRFDVLGVECYDCHRISYESTTKPNHAANNYSTNCTDCHKMNGLTWPEVTNTDHNFFPLTKGHAIEDCGRCHKSMPYSSASSECFSCHQPNYTASTNPNHMAVGIPNNCATCHTTNPGWQPATYTHKEPFPLKDAHQAIANECATCHAGNYSNPVNTCEGCHITNFNQTTNPNHTTAQIATTCETCHTQVAWTPATYTHKEPYPLTDFHLTIANDCFACHAGNYSNPENTCVGCHLTNFNATTNPNHSAAQFSTACETCHSQVAWIPSTFDHNTIYPLEGAHAIIANNCTQCHANGYPNTPNTCVGCHLTNYNQTTDPNHTAAQFPTTCADCHTQTAWKPASFDHDGQFFPIYSGKHNGQWNACADCHTNPSNFTIFTCTTSCHPQASTNNEHQGVGGYQYVSAACLACHPNGAANGFDHAAAGFPLTGGHSTVACTSCHASGYIGTSPVCAGCHTTNYNQTTNPNHTAIGISNSCSTCHTLNPGWSPATFPTHNNYYVLAGAHISKPCADCHNGNYNSIPNTCAGCHQTNYNQTTNPNHAAAQFPTTCADCHTQSAWTPATFNHDGLYFPIYSGKHNGNWNSCADCHTNPSNYAVYTCTTACHPQSTMNNEHQGVGGYQYISSACLACHPTGNAGGAFNHNTSPFPLTGGHASVDCASCHTNGYTGTSTICASCHINNYNQTTDPNHSAIGISTDCVTCHTTNPGWNPATFPTHNNYYVLAGAHVSVACANCHNGNYIATPNTCAGCHINNYNQTTNPNHAAAQFPTTCADCHSQSAWTPSTFNHDGQYFPIYSGKHNGNWNSCADCHTNPSNYAVYTCTTSCHPQSSMNNQHQGVGGYQYVSSACLACHPTGNAGGAFNHNTSPFPLTGGHSSVDCASCHASGYTGTSTLCAGCHTDNYNQTTDPNHSAIGISTDCASCHTTNPGWNPATFPTHNNYYVLAGAHVAIANNCAVCHQGNYVNSPNTCYGCHADNYNQTTNPNHVTSQFATTCETCHSQNAWVPSTFNHNNTYPLTGAHATIASNCVLCHANGYSNTPNTCVGCHQTNYNQATNPNHNTLGLSNNCSTCHTTNPGWAPATFPVHNSYYVLAGAHVAIANQCVDCHNGNYNNTPNTCSGCHMTNYNQTTNPNHASAQFPTTCADCHTQSAWTPSTFNHDGQYFPIYSGKHKNKWNTCSQCHQNAANFASFTCIASCHSQSSTNGDHQGVNGYAYNSDACYNCHPNGNAGKVMDNSFNRTN
ncbi:MAG: hypothetical protein ACOYMF_03000 [Bacteroidales bacterium]